MRVDAIDIVGIATRGVERFAHADDDVFWYHPRQVSSVGVHVPSADHCLYRPADPPGVFQIADEDGTDRLRQ